MTSSTPKISRILPSGLRGQLLLLIVSVLIVQLGLFASLEILLRQTEAEAARLEKARELISATNRLCVQIFVVQTAGARFATNRSEKALAEARSASREALVIHHWLQDQFRDSEEDKLVQKIGFELTETVKKANYLLDLVAQSPIGHTFYVLGTQLNDLRRMTEQLNTDILVFQNEQHKIELSSPALTNQGRDLVNALIFAGFAFNVIFAIGVAIFLSRHIVSRLDVLISNSGRLSLDLPLLPVSQGRDEIAQLDSVFHRMAGQIKEEQMLLKAGEAKVRSILERMPVGLLVLADNGTIEFANAKMLAISGFEMSELINRPLALLFRVDESKTEVEVINELRARGSDKTVELPMLKQNRDSLQVEFSMGSMSSLEGKADLVAIADVTERHAIEQMRQAFVAMVSHDIRTPLTGVHGFLDLILMGALGQVSEALNQHARQTERSVSRLIELVNDLLRLEKLESGIVELKFHTARLRPILTEAAETVGNIAAAKAISLTVEDRSTSAAQVDSMRILQVIINLLSNALKFAPEHSEVKLNADEKESEFVISVSDDGPGIAKDDQQAIFDRFRQVGGKDSQGKEGFGLGLAICKAIVEQHGGTIGLESAVGRGSRFWFTIPKREESTDES